MITIKELLGKNELKDIPEVHVKALNGLLEAVNRLRTAYGKAMLVSSGYRSMVEHLRIYNDKGIVDIKNIPMKSAHLSGEAVDFSDPDNRLKNFINSCTNEQLEVFGLYFEDFKHTSNWVHCQIRKPASGKRFFIP
jgi:uncharacterized protein YcbK (DUF882 family)